MSTSASWSDLLLHFFTLSPVAMGGVLAAAPEMHRFLVDQTALLTDQQFASSIAIAQASPGPNLMFVAIFGWHAGTVLAGSWLGQVAGMLGTMAAILIPSSTLTLMTTRWIQAQRGHPVLYAITSALAPISLGLIFSTSWVLASAHNQPARDWRLWLLTLGAMLAIARTRIPILFLLAAGAAAGALGLV